MSIETAEMTGGIGMGVGFRVAEFMHPERKVLREVMTPDELNLCQNGDSLYYELFGKVCDPPEFRFEITKTQPPGASLAEDIHSLTRVVYGDGDFYDDNRKLAPRVNKILRHFSIEGQRADTFFTGDPENRRTIEILAQAFFALRDTEAPENREMTAKLGVRQKDVFDMKERVARAMVVKAEREFKGVQIIDWKKALYFGVGVPVMGVGLGGGLSACTPLSPDNRIPVVGGGTPGGAVATESAKYLQTAGVDSTQTPTAIVTPPPTETPRPTATVTNTLAPTETLQPTATATPKWGGDTVSIASGYVYGPGGKDGNTFVPLSVISRIKEMNAAFLTTLPDPILLENGKELAWNKPIQVTMRNDTALLQPAVYIGCIDTKGNPCTGAGGYEYLVFGMPQDGRTDFYLKPINTASASASGSIAGLDSIPADWLTRKVKTEEINAAQKIIKQQIPQRTMKNYLTEGERVMLQFRRPLASNVDEVPTLDDQFLQLEQGKAFIAGTQNSPLFDVDVIWKVGPTGAKPTPTFKK